MNYNKIVKTNKRGKLYKQWVKDVIVRDNHTCVICGRTEGLGAHHLNSWAFYPELRYDISNGVTVCTKNDMYGNCHTTFHCDYKDSFRDPATEKDFREFTRIAKYLTSRLQGNH